jgi:hypothetical protein
VPIPRARRQAEEATLAPEIVPEDVATTLPPVVPAEETLTVKSDPQNKTDHFKSFEINTNIHFYNGIKITV